MAGIADFARGTYDLGFQVSPVILTGGLASGIPGGMLPIMGLLGGMAGFAQGLLTTGALSMQDFPWRFVPIPGSTAIAQTAATYPFANRRIAANATVEQPKNVSLRMIAPVNQAGGFITKLPLFTSLQSSLSQHNNTGGTYIVVTPSLIYPNCLLLNVSDVTPDGSGQKQTMWQWDFVQPLISQQQATGALNGLMNMISGGSKFTNPSWSGVGSSINTGIAGVTQGAQGLVNSGISGIVGSL